MNVSRIDTRSKSQRDRALSRRQRAALLLVGSSAVAYGLRKRDWLGRALLMGGGYFLYRAGTGMMPKEISAEVSQTVNRAVEDIYGFWRDFKNWPLFMKGMNAIRLADPRTIEWSVEGRSSVKGWSKITQEEPGKTLRWSSTIGKEAYEGAIELRPAPGNRGTEIHLRLLWRNPTGAITQIFKNVTGDSLEQQGRESLRALKQLLEAGEVPTTNGQPHGARGLKGKAERAIFRESIDERRRPTRQAPLPNQQLAVS